MKGRKKALKRALRELLEYVENCWIMHDGSHGRATYRVVERDIATKKAKAVLECPD